MIIKFKLLFISVPVSLSLVLLGGVLQTTAQTSEPNSSSSRESPSMNDNTTPQKKDTLPTFKVRPLIDASQEEVIQAAINFTRANFAIISGIPQVVLVRPITTEQFPSLGFGEVGGSLDEKLMLVVLKGNFDASRLIPIGDSSKPNNRVVTKYIAYVFDLRSGIPTYTVGGLRGKYFRELLKDISIPDISLPQPREAPDTVEAVPAEKLPAAVKLPYGTTIPGLTKDEIMLLRRLSPQEMPQKLPQEPQKPQEQR